MRVLSPPLRDRSRKADIKAQQKRERLEQEKSLRNRRRYAAQRHTDGTYRFYRGLDKMKVGICMGFALIFLATYFFSRAFADSETVLLVPGLPPGSVPSSYSSADRDIIQSISSAALAGPFGQSLDARFSSSDIRTYERVVSWIFSRKPSQSAVTYKL